MRSLSFRTLAGAAFLIFVLFVSPARAQPHDITVRDQQTGAEAIIKAYEITRENWKEIRYRERKKGPIKRIPTADIVGIKRTGKDASEKWRVAAGIARLTQGGLDLLREVTGAGVFTNLEGDMIYRSFAANDAGKKRPPWWSEYAHFFQAKALYLLGKKTADAQLLERAHLALVDQAVPKHPKTRSGGFLKRFAKAKSRFMPEAMHIAAETLLLLGRHKEAAVAFRSLRDAAVKRKWGLRWTQAARLGQADVAAAEGRLAEAARIAKEAAIAARVLIGKETRAWAAREIGILHARSRMRAAAFLLRQAEADPSGLKRQALGMYVEEGLPSKLAAELTALPPGERRAVLAGALDSRVQAVALNCVGWLALQDKELEEARLALHAVDVKHFDEAEWHARALHFLARTLDESAAAAEGERSAAYRVEAEDARKRLRGWYPGSSWAERD